MLHFASKSTAGALGFWKALDEMFPATRHQRCWLHKTLNVLDKFPKSVQPNAHKDLREIWLAPDRATAETASRRHPNSPIAVKSRMFRFLLTASCAAEVKMTAHGEY